MKNVDIVNNTEALMAPVRALNELALAKTSALVDLQLNVARKYADLGLASFKDAVAVKDAEGAKAYFAAQAEVARKTGETVAADAKAFNQLGVDYVVAAQKIVKDSVEKMPKLAA